MRNILFIIVLIVGGYPKGKTQVSLEWNAFIDLELSKAGDLSHYFYNEIHINHTDWRFDLTQFTGIANLYVNDHWSLQTQFLVDRNFGEKAGLFKKLEAYQLRINVLNITYEVPEKPLVLKAGRFISPFGRFYQNQIFGKRDVIHTPLAYSFYNNISNYFGLFPEVGETYRPRIEDFRDWGLPLLYNFGYQTGVLGIYGNPEKLSFAFGLTNGAPNLPVISTSPFQVGVVGRLGFRPSYFSKIGISFSHGTFIEAVAQNSTLENLKDYTQSLVGLDFELGGGYWEWSGEFIWGHYRVPVYDGALEAFAIKDRQGRFWLEFLFRY